MRKFILLFLVFFALNNIHSQASIIKKDANTLKTPCELCEECISKVDRSSVDYLKNRLVCLTKSYCNDCSIISTGTVEDRVRELVLGGADVNCNTEDDKAGDKCTILFKKGMRIYVLEEPDIVGGLTLQIRKGKRNLIKQKSKYSSYPITEFLSKTEIESYGYTEKAKVVFYPYKLKSTRSKFNGEVTINLLKGQKGKLEKINTSIQKMLIVPIKMW